MITEFIKDHKIQCLIVLIAIIVLLIIANVRGKDKSQGKNSSDTMAQDFTGSGSVDVSSQLENDVTAQTVYSNYIYAVE